MKGEALRETIGFLERSLQIAKLGQRGVRVSRPMEPGVAQRQESERDQSEGGQAFRSASRSLTTGDRGR